MRGTAAAAGWPSLFWMAFERSANLMTLVQPDRVLVAINQAGVKALGYQREQLIGRRADVFIAPSYWKRVEADWMTLARIGRVCGDRELVRADGRHLRIQYAAHREVVTGRQLVLWVALESRLRPLTRGDGDEGETAALTARELEVVSEVAMGRRAHEIAGDLHIAPTTVRTHLRNAMMKVGARSQAQLVAITLAQGMLNPASINRL